MRINNTNSNSYTTTTKTTTAVRLAQHPAGGGMGTANVHRPTRFAYAEYPHLTEDLARLVLAFAGYGPAARTHNYSSDMTGAKHR